MIRLGGGTPQQPCDKRWPNVSRGDFALRNTVSATSSVAMAHGTPHLPTLPHTAKRHIALHRVHEIRWVDKDIVRLKVCKCLWGSQVWHPAVSRRNDHSGSAGQGDSSLPTFLGWKLGLIVFVLVLYLILPVRDNADEATTIAASRVFSARARH